MPLYDAPLHWAEWTIQPTFEHRIRFERRLDKDFNESLSDNTTDWLYRTRLGFIATSKSGDRITFTYQNGYDDLMAFGGDTITKASDVPILSWERNWGQWTTILGRQTYRLGDGRLVSSQFSWGNLGRTFEGAVVKNKAVEAAWLREAVNTPSNKEINLGIASYKHELGQTSVIFKEDDRTPEETRHVTVNHIYKTKIGQNDLTLEADGQLGRLNGRQHQAYAFVANLSSQPAKALKTFVEGAVYSGGSGPKSGTFDSLYAAPSLTYGLRTQVGCRNSIELSLGSKWQVDPKLRLDSVLTFVSLFNDEDGWYGLSGSLNKKKGGSFIDPTGGSGRNVGSFLQIEACYSATKHDIFGAGVGIFLPGSFVKSQLGGSADTQYWGFLQYTYRF